MTLTQSGATPFGSSCSCLRYSSERDKSRHHHRIIVPVQSSTSQQVHDCIAHLQVISHSFFTFRDVKTYRSIRILPAHSMHSRHGPPLESFGVLLRAARTLQPMGDSLGTIRVSGRDGFLAQILPVARAKPCPRSGHSAPPISSARIVVLGWTQLNTPLFRKLGPLAELPSIILLSAGRASESWRLRPPRQLDNDDTQ